MPTERRIFLARLPLVALGLMVFTSCRSSRRSLIGIVPPDGSRVFWQGVHAGAVAAGNELGADVLWQAPGDHGDASEQIAIVEALIDRPVDGIALGPRHPTALAPSVARAAAADIPVTILESTLETERAVTRVASDNEAAGRQAAQEIARVLDESGRIGVVKYRRGCSWSEEREQGFAALINDKYSGLEIVGASYCEGRRDQAQFVSRELLTQHAGLAALFCSSEEATVGAMRALRAGPSKRAISLVGFGSAPTLQQGLMDAVVHALVMRDPFFVGYTGVKSLLQVRQGIASPREIAAPTRLIRAADLDRAAVDKLLNPIVPRRPGR